MRANQFVKLKMKRLGVTVLRILNEEDNQKSQKTGGSINDQLPCVGKMENWPADSPDNKSHDGSQEHHGMSNEPGGLAGKAAEPEIDVIGLRYLLARLCQRRLLLCFCQGLPGLDTLVLNLLRLALRFCDVSIHTSLDADSVLEWSTHKEQ